MKRVILTAAVLLSAVIPVFANFIDWDAGETIDWEIENTVDWEAENTVDWEAENIVDWDIAEAPEVITHYDEHTPMKREERPWSAEQLNALIDLKAGKEYSVMRGQAQAFLDASANTGISVIDLISQAAHESDWGTSNIARNKGQLFGWGAIDSDPYNGAWGYEDVYSGIIATVDQISDKYVENGSDTFYLLQNPEEAPGQEDWRRYASDGEYENKLTDIRNEIYDSLSGYTYSEPEPEPARQTIQKFDWFDYADYWFERQSTAMVTDVLTGKVFDIFRIGGSLHADIVPFTAADTATFKSITGDWTWERRPVWITHNGETSAASIHSQPHTDYPQYFNNNDMYGHVCLHFLNSRTHEDNAGTIEAVDARHQACVSEAYQAGWR